MELHDPFKPLELHDSFKPLYDSSFQPKDPVPMQSDGSSPSLLEGRRVSQITTNSETTGRVDQQGIQGLKSSGETPTHSPIRKSIDLTGPKSKEVDSQPVISQENQQTKVNIQAVSEQNRVKNLRRIYEKLGSVVPSDVYEEPKRRTCGFKDHMKYKDERTRIEKETFLSNAEILRSHPMKFLPKSPLMIQEDPELLDKIQKHDWWMELLNERIKEIEGIAVTEKGQHVILQQGTRSGAQACVAMLLLDRGKFRDYNSLSNNYSYSMGKDIIKLLQKGSLQGQITPLPRWRKMTFLSKSLEKNGCPGILHIFSPKLGRPLYIVLDKISVKDNTAVIRDPFHGRMVTIKLNVLEKMIKESESDAEFIQVTDPTAKKAA